jgi:hypothetical protein
MKEVLNPAFGSIGNALKSTAADHVVAVATDIYDAEQQMRQSDINQLVLQAGATASNHYYMSTDQYSELITNGEVVIDGVKYIYDENAYYALYELEE